MAAAGKVTCRHLSKLLLLLTILDFAAAEAARQELASVNSAQKTAATATNQGVFGVIGMAANIPCEVTPLTPSDSPVLILWYRDIFGTPIYSFDMRSELSGRHWMERKTLGNRASFHMEETGLDTTDGVRILRAFLRIEKLRKSDEGPYRCRVDFKQAPTRNVKIKLILIERPGKPEIINGNGTLVSEDQSPPMRVNSTLVLSCKTYRGTPTPDLFWWREDRKRSSRQKLLGHQTVEGEVVTSVVRLDRLDREDLGTKIGCSANNTDLVEPEETSFKINMILPPIRAKIVRELSYFLAGKPYNVSCQVLGSHPSAYTKAWIGERELKIADFQVQEDDISTTRISFLPSVEDNGRFLACRAENPHLPVNNAVEDQWKIDVQYVPRTELALRGAAHHRTTKVEVNEGELVELKCLVNANPPAHTTHWRKNGNTIDYAHDLKDQTLFLRSVSARARGSYSCLAENMLGIGESNALEVLVKYRPVCQHSGELLWFVALGETVEIPCKVDAYPVNSLNFSWTMEREGEQISLSNHDPSRSSWIEHNSKLPTTSSLFFSPTSSGDYGKLLCEATNEAGKQAKACVFQIRSKGLPKIDTCDIQSSGLDWTRVRCLAGSASEHDALDEEEWELQTKLRVVVAVQQQKGEWMVVANETHALQQNEVTITGLSPGSRYRLLVTAWNPRRVPQESEVPVEVQLTTKRSEEPVTTMSIPINDPIRLLPVIGGLAVVVIVLVLVAVAIVVVMRSRSQERGDPSLKTHVGFNRSLDLDIETDKKKSAVDEEILKNLESISKLDGCDHLHDVRFEGFTSIERRRSSGHAEKYQTPIPPKALHKQHSLLESDLDFAPSAAAAAEVFVHDRPKSEVPVGSLCIIDDGEKTEVFEGGGGGSMVYLQNTAENDHYGFREAIPAPTPTVRRLSQLAFAAHTSTISANDSTTAQQPNWTMSGQLRVTFALDNDEEGRTNDYH